ncbi:hypothetical protein SPHS8_02382 [Sphingobium sp. S8]|nr:hypothetical protein SPHS8_02382 [Sphingobium sp. S8]
MTKARLRAERDSDRKPSYVARQFQAREQPAVFGFLIHHLVDGMIQRLRVEIGAKCKLSAVQLHHGPVLKADRIDVPRLIPCEITARRVVQSIHFVQCARQFLPYRLCADVEAGFHTLAELDPDIAVEAQRAPLTMSAVTIRPVGGNCCPGISTVIRIAIGRLGPERIKRTAIDAKFSPRRCPPGRRHCVDRATQRRSTKPRSIAAAIHLQMLENLRVQFLKVPIVIGHVDGNAILQQGQAAHMEASRKARAADRNPNLLPEAGLRVDASGKSKRIAQRYGQLVLEILGGDDVGAPSGTADIRSGVLRGRGSRNNDAALIARLISQGGYGHQRTGKCAQRNAARSGRCRHEFILMKNRAALRAA